MAEEKPKKSTSKAKTAKVFDVSHPSKTIAPSTSKPVIVGHTNSMKQDPMVSPVEKVPVNEPEKEPEQEILDKPKRELNLSPLSVQADNVEAKEETTEEAQDTGVIESFDVPELAETPEEEPEQIEETEQAVQDEELPDDSETNPKQENNEGMAAVEAIVAGVNTKKERRVQEEKEAQRAAEIQGMIASKKYYVKTQLPPGKRNLRWLMVLILVALIAAGGWYIAAGPGKELWSKDPVVQTTAPAPTPPVQNTEQKEGEDKSTEAAQVEYKNAELGVSFSHPSDWKVEGAADTEFDTRYVITLSSPVETIKTQVNGAEPVDSEVFLRTKIIIENTTNPAEYASDLAGLTSCATEDIVIGSTALKLIYHDSTQPAPIVSQVSVGSGNCTAVGNAFNANDQIQLSTKKNTYVIYSEYVFSDAHLRKNGTETADAISLAQSSGVSAAKDAYKAGKNFIKFQELVSSFKEL